MADERQPGGPYRSRSEGQGQGRSSSNSSDGPGGRSGGGGRFQRRRVCAFCADKVEKIDYKDVNTLRRFLSEQGQIDSRRRTGTCARHQRRLTVAIKRARLIALLPYTAEHIRRYG